MEWGGGGASDIYGELKDGWRKEGWVGLLRNGNMHGVAIGIGPIVQILSFLLVVLSLYIINIIIYTNVNPQCIQISLTTSIFIIALFAVYL